MKTLFVIVCILMVFSFLIWKFEDSIKNRIGDELYEESLGAAQCVIFCFSIWLLCWIVLG
jgi:hypothetical protein